MENNVRRDINNKIAGSLERALGSLREILSGRNCEAIQSILGGMLRDLEEGGSATLQDAIEKASRGKMSSPGLMSINTYPFGKKPAPLFPDFLGVCAGKQRLADVLNVAARQCARMSAKFGADVPKSVTILTDKWHNPLFHAVYERSFISYALRYNVMFVFLLVAGHGMVRIPFLTETRGELERWRARGYVLELESLGEEDIERRHLGYPTARYPYDDRIWEENDGYKYRYFELFFRYLMDVIMAKYAPAVIYAGLDTNKASLGMLTYKIADKPVCGAGVSDSAYHKLFLVKEGVKQVHFSVSKTVFADRRTAVAQAIVAQVLPRFGDLIKTAVVTPRGFALKLHRRLLTPYEVEKFVQVVDFILSIYLQEYSKKP